MNDKEQKELDQKLWDAVNDIEPQISHVQFLIEKGADVNYVNIENDNITVIEIAEMWLEEMKKNLHEAAQIMKILKENSKCQQ
jgi:hypothetical protein